MKKALSNYVLDVYEYLDTPMVLLANLTLTMVLFCMSAVSFGFGSFGITIMLKASLVVFNVTGYVVVTCLLLALLKTKRRTAIWQWLKDVIHGPAS